MTSHLASFTPSNIKFSSSLVIDKGGTGVRAIIMPENGENIMIQGAEDEFSGSINLRYTEFDHDPTAEEIYTKLAERFVERTLDDDRTYQHQDSKETLAEIFKKDPVRRVFTSSAGMITTNGEGKPMIVGSENLPEVLQDVPILDTIRSAFTKVFDAKGHGELIKDDEFNTKGWCFNDALSGVMALAAKLTAEGKDITKESFLYADIGSGVATGGIDRGRLYTTEAQNVGLYGAINETSEDSVSIRGILQNSIRALKTLPDMQRRQNPVYQILRDGFMSRDKQRTRTDFNNLFKEVDDTKAIGKQGWEEKWLDIQRFMAHYFEKPEEPIAKSAMERLYDRLAGMVAFKSMERSASRAYVQFLDWRHASPTNGTTDRDATYMSKLTQAVNDRLWGNDGHTPNYIVNQAKHVVDRNTVHELFIQNFDGLGWLPQAIKLRPDLEIQGVPDEVLKNLV